VVARTAHAAQFMQFKDEYPKLRFELVLTESDGGSADALRHARDRIRVRAVPTGRLLRPYHALMRSGWGDGGGATQTDFLLLSADVVTDADLSQLADLHWTKDAAVTALVADTRRPALPALKRPRASPHPRACCCTCTCTCTCACTCTCTCACAYVCVRVCFGTCVG
jgi:NDP-sugar pyrophosphorylase family protein